MSRACRVAAVVALVALAAANSQASQVRVLQTQGKSSLLGGTLEGISVDQLGRLHLADRSERVAEVEEPFLLGAVAVADGWVVATGNSGRVLRVSSKGEISELFVAPEPEVFCLWADDDGTVFAGTSPQGKVYRIPPQGPAEVYFDPQATYIWALARGTDGSLLVATGSEGKLFRVTAKDEGKLLYDSDDVHLRSLAVRADGGILVGTAGEGLILLVDGEGQARTLYDGAAPEVAALTLGPDGTAYATLVASEASRVELGATASASSGSASSSASSGSGEEGAEQTAVSLGAVTAGSRRAGYSGPRSELVSLTANGRVEKLGSFQEETVYALLWWRDRLWVATGLDGQLFSYQPADDSLVLENRVDDHQIVALLRGDPGPAFSTTNAAAVYRLLGASEPRGTYTSEPLDAGEISRFGSLYWEGDLPSGSAVTFAVRSGMSAEPDRTWSPWTSPKQGQEIALDDLPRGRYVQWRAELSAGKGASPQILGAEISYLQDNLKPEVERFAALDPGQVLVPANFNPTNQVYEPAHPNREGIFTTLGALGKSEDNRLKPLWKQGYRSLRWEATDPNEDELLFDLHFRPEAGEGPWMTLAEDLEDSYYSFDATVLPDGVYRFRLRASDETANPTDEALVTEQISDPVVVDHTPPALGPVKTRGRRMAVSVHDALSPIREAVVSVDAGEWRPVDAEDHLVDGRSEVLAVEVPRTARLVLLRLTDAAFNVITYDLSHAIP